MNKIKRFAKWSDLNGFGGGLAGYALDKGYYTWGDLVFLVFQGLLFSPWFVIISRVGKFFSKKVVDV